MFCSFIKKNNIAFNQRSTNGSITKHEYFVFKCVANKTFPIKRINSCGKFLFI